MRRIVWGMVLVILVTATVAAAAVWMTLRTYQVLSRRQVVAVIECRPSLSRAEEFRLVYRPVTDGKPGPAQIYQLDGDQWAVGGDLLIWRGWALIAGARTWYKVTRVEGRYATAERAMAHPLTAYDVDGGSDWLWRWLYRWQRWIPGVEAVYGGSVFMPPDSQKQFVLYVTPSGFLVKSQRRK